MLWHSLLGIGIFLCHALLFAYLAPQVRPLPNGFLFEKGIYCSLAVLAYWIYRQSAGWMDLPDATAPARRKIESLLATLSTALGLYVMVRVFIYLVGHTIQSENNQNLESISILTILVSGFLTPAAEELLYRAGLFQFLRRSMSPVAATFLASFCFAIVHPMLTAPFMLVCGLAFTVLYWRYGLASSILAHVVYNLLILLSTG